MTDGQGLDFVSSERQRRDPNAHSFSYDGGVICQPGRLVVPLMARLPKSQLKRAFLRFDYCQLMTPTISMASPDDAADVPTTSHDFKL